MPKYRSRHPRIATKAYPKFDVELALEGINERLEAILKELRKTQSSDPSRYYATGLDNTVGGQRIILLAVSPH